MIKDARLVILFQEMADLTSARCGKTCSRRPPQSPTRCCDEMYCSIAKEYAKEEYGVELQETGHLTIPFMSDTGCVVAPHLRPLCALHECNINSMGFTKEPEFDKRYFELREKINEVAEEIEEAKEQDADQNE